jgi:hypothetical protein
MTTKVLATLTALIGAIGIVYALFAAFGIELTSAQQDAITGVAGLVLVVAGIWLHPSVPVGEQK